jgi:hypothetical protein
MPDIATGTDSARVEKYSPDQVAQSRDLLGHEPTADELRAHHGTPADGRDGDD